MGNLTYDFRGRTAVVTGAARGIGLEIARFFARSGATVIAVDVDRDELESAVRPLGAVPVAGDVSRPQTAHEAVERAMTGTGRVDVLVNNAGVLRDAVVWKTSDEDWDLVLAVHAGGTFRMTRACIPVFRAQRYGRVINVTSTSGVHGNFGQAAYATAKAGIIGFTKTVARETARFGVTVNALLPNADTRMIESIPEDRRREIAGSIPMGRFGDPAEMCAAVGFLASEEAGYVTGIVLPVDGGISM